VLGLYFVSLSLWAAASPDLLQRYALQARSDNPSFAGFSEERGAAFYHATQMRDGQKLGCVTCHTPDPRKPGETRAHKTIEPMALVANPQRFTDAAKTEKWFDRNCRHVLERACTAQEKGDFIQYLSNLK
jgi:hypothetical protein